MSERFENLLNCPTKLSFHFFLIKLKMYTLSLCIITSILNVIIVLLELSQILKLFYHSKF